MSGSRPTRAAAATHPDKIKCPGNDVNPAENWAMQGRVRARQEMLNGRLKTWGILSHVFRHRIAMHADVFRACAVVMQLTNENGEPRNLRWGTKIRDRII